MSRYGVPNWPPVWTWVDGLENTLPKGEVGILKWVGLSGIEPIDRCYLYMNHEGSSYLGCLLFEVTESEVTVDANHPLAGEDLIFDIELIDMVYGAH
jgi:hypothetical protein